VDKADGMSLFELPSFNFLTVGWEVVGWDACCLSAAAPGCCWGCAPDSGYFL